VGSWISKPGCARQVGRDRYCRVRRAVLMITLQRKIWPAGRARLGTVQQEGRRWQCWRITGFSLLREDVLGRARVFPAEVLNTMRFTSGAGAHRGQERSAQRRVRLGPRLTARGDVGRIPKSEEGAAMKIRPLHDRFWWSARGEGSQEGRDHHSRTARKSPGGKVIAVGTVRSRRGQEVRWTSSGDKSLREVFRLEVKLDDKEYLIMREDDVLAILE